MNRYVLEKGIGKGELEVKEDLTMYGRYSRPITDFLAYSDEPFLPSLSYNPENCEKFLYDLGISLKEGDKWKTYSELDFEEKKKLVSALAKLLIDKGMGWAAEKLVGETYLLKNRMDKPSTFDATEFSTVLNACGRNSHPEIGVALCLGEEGSYEAALSLLRTHKSAIREGVLFAKRNINDFGPFFFIDARGVIADSIVGIVCGMVMGGKKKPILGAALSESGLKISSRGTNKLVEAGLNLGAAMNHASEKVGGVGGGHKIAAGANIPEGTLNPFLEAIGEFLRQ
jgi:single-stranded-DNA-specific exonuclease